MAQPEILLVEDEADILDLGTTFLREAGYTVMPAISGDIAFIYLEQGLRFKLLVTDVVLPGLLDGFALAHKARELIPDIPVIYATGYAGTARVRSIGAPYGQTILKPWRRTELLDIVATLLRHPASA